MRRTILGVAMLWVSVIASASEPPSLEIFALGDFELESGATLTDAKLGYRTSGTLDAEKSNAILFPTWFTGTSEDLFTTGAVDPIDTDRFFLITVDAFGNGVSSSPSNHSDFPRVTIGDMVHAQYRLIDEVFGIDRLHAVMGISMGGMQTFEWITRYPDAMTRAMPIVGSPRLGSYDVLLWEAQLEAIDLARQTGEVERAAPLVGMIHTLAIQTPDYHARRTPRSETAELLEIAKQGGSQTMEDRAVQLRAMITHDVSRRFDGSLEKAASVVEARVVNVVGLQDHMVTPQPAIRFAALLGAESIELDNHCGHMATLCDPERFVRAVHTFLQ